MVHLDKEQTQKANIQKSTTAKLPPIFQQPRTAFVVVVFKTCKSRSCVRARDNHPRRPSRAAAAHYDSSYLRKVLFFSLGTADPELHGGANRRKIEPGGKWGVWVMENRRRCRT